MKQLEEYIDQYGCICRKEYGGLTGGDSWAFAGFWAVLTWTSRLIKLMDKDEIIEKYKKYYNLHLTPSGVHVRHPNPNPEQSWWGSVGFTSRDQYMSNVAFWCLAGLHDYGKQHLKMVTKNKFFYWNKDRFIDGKIVKNLKPGDFVGFDQLGIILRSCGYWWLWPVYWITDTFGLLSSIWKVIYSYWMPSHQDDQTRICILIAQTKKYPTPVAYISKWIYYLRAAWILNGEYFHIHNEFWLFNKNDRASVLKTYKLTLSDFGPEWAMTTRFGRKEEPPFDIMFRMTDF